MKEAIFLLIGAFIAGSFGFAQTAFDRRAQFVIVLSIAIHRLRRMDGEELQTLLVEVVGMSSDTEFAFLSAGPWLLPSERRRTLTWIDELRRCRAWVEYTGDPLYNHRDITGSHGAACGDEKAIFVIEKVHGSSGLNGF